MWMETNPINNVTDVETDVTPFFNRCETSKGTSLNWITFSGQISFGIIERSRIYFVQKNVPLFRYVH